MMKKPKFKVNDVVRMKSELRFEKWFTSSKLVIKKIITPAPEIYVYTVSISETPNYNISEDKLELVIKKNPFEIFYDSQV